MHPPPRPRSLSVPPHLPGRPGEGDSCAKLLGSDDFTAALT